jgi:putative FmdB family regulatory protein
MPLYEYRCRVCGVSFEKLVLKREQEILCPSCGARTVERLISVCNFGSRDGSVRSSSSGSCATCTSSSCSSCSGH